MRFVLAISALVLSGVMLILGIGQVTFLAGPRSVSFAEQLDSPSGLAVIDAEQFSAAPGQANIEVTGARAFAAVGYTRDVVAWAAPFGHAGIETDAASRSLRSSPVPADRDAADAYLEASGGTAEGEEAEAQLLPPSPYGSDLWLEQRGADPAEEAAEAPAENAEAAEETAAEAVQTVRMPVALSPDQSVLVAVDPEAGPAEVSVVWVQDRRTPWAGPLLAAGGALALIGAVLYLIAVDHDRRGLGPRRGRRGPLIGIRNLFGRKSRRSRTMRAVALPAIGLSAALALSGCSPSYWPDFSPEETPVEEQTTTESSAAVAPVPVSQGQIDRILADIAAISGAADDALDPAGLESRFSSDALEERVANYKIRAAVSDYEVVVPRITDETLGYQLVQSTEGWPRTIFVVVASESGDAPAAGEEEAPAAEETAETDALESETVEEQSSPSLAIIMSQAGPHENYLVSRTIALRGGITMPEAAPAEEGTALLADDLQTLVMTPAEVGPAYAAVLAGGTGVEQAASFDLEGDSLIARSGSAWVAQSTEAAEAAGQGIVYSVAAQQSENKIVSLSTGVGGALVATTVLETRTEAPEEGSRWRPTVPKTLAALSDLDGQQDKLVSTVAHQLLFFVPSATSEGPIQLLGYTSDLIAAGNE